MDPHVFPPRSTPDFQPQRAEPDAFERDAGAIVRAWAVHAYQPERADAVLSERLPLTRRRDDRSLLLLSRACQALAATVCWPEPLGDVAQRLAPLQDEARDMGWPRASWLVEAAQAFLVLRAPQEVRVAEAIARLRLHPSAVPLGQRPGSGAAGRTPIEAFWTAAALCGLLAVQGDLEAAVAHGLLADDLATRSSVSVLLDQSALVLAHALVCNGDLDGAVDVLARRTSTALPTTPAQRQLQGNLILAHVLAGRTAEARPLAALWPELQWPAVQQQGPGLRFLAALLALEVGDADGADRLLGPDTEATVPDGWCMGANRAWLRGRIALAQGRPDDARHACREHRAQADHAGLPLPPLQATHILHVESAACEALGDLPGALQALKQAHLACTQWAGASLRAHMQLVRQAGQATPTQHPLQGLQGMAALRTLSDLENRQRQFMSPSPSPSPERPDTG